MGKATDFFTREQANEGVKIPLTNPCTGKDEWVKIRGADSDIFRAAEIDSLRQALEIAELPKKEQAKKNAAARLELLSILVIDWSFDEPCNHEEILKVLKNAPLLAGIVNTQAAKRSLFIQKKSKTSKATQSQNSNSRKSQKERK